MNETGYLNITRDVIIGILCISDKDYRWNVSNTSYTLKYKSFSYLSPTLFLQLYRLFVWAICIAHTKIVYHIFIRMCEYILQNLYTMKSLPLQADLAPDAVLHQGRRLYLQHQAPFGAHRQRHLLRIIPPYCGDTAALHRSDESWVGWVSHRLFLRLWEELGSVWYSYRDNGGIWNFSQIYLVYNLSCEKWYIWLSTHSCWAFV